jgi:glyoxylase-like metal-dependent hydrolase (beta-lactamase superfamily II)
MKEILPGIHTWSVFNQEKGLDFNGHCVAGADGCVLIDPPALSDDQARHVDRLGPPTAVLITNCHHTRESMAAAARWNVPILMPEKDAGAIPAGVRLGGFYRDGDLLPGGLIAFGLQDQKSPGETALVCVRARAIILGDALIGKPPGKFSLLPDAKYADPRRAREGLRRLLDLEFDGVLVGDGASIPRGGRKVMEDLLAAG